jgi:hypothetical protein
MKNVIENRVSATFTKDELADMLDKRKDLMAIIKPKTIALNDEELASLGSMAVDNFVFVKETLKTTDEEGVALLAPGIAAMVPEFTIDVAFFDQLAAEEAAMEDLLTRIRHTKRLVAHESYKVANSVYGQYQSLAEDGIPGAAARFNLLKERYKGNGPGRPNVEE